MKREINSDLTSEGQTLNLLLEGKRGIRCKRKFVNFYTFRLGKPELHFNLYRETQKKMV